MPPDRDEVRRLLRPHMADIPSVLAQWPQGSGPLADVPLLDPGLVAPRRFEQLAGTVRVAGASPALVTMAGLLEIPDNGGLLVTAMTVGPDDLGDAPDPAAARRALALEGARSDGVRVEVAVLLSALDPDGGPAAGVGIVRPLVYADPAAFPHPEDTTPYGADLQAAVRLAAAEDREAVADLGAGPMDPLPPDLARIWSPMFEVARAATVGLAARGAGQGG
ncbi:hypothetical protein BH23ACT9_BH23ACT9_12880 [soil metagenome]